MNKLLAVFWDVDGTIADTELCGHRVAFNLAFKDFDLNWYWDEKKYLELLKISGGLNRIIHYRDIINSALSLDDCAELQSKKSIYYKQLVQSGKIKIRDGVVRLMEELATEEIDQYIVTTSGRLSLNPFLNSTLKDYLDVFSGIITYEDVAKHKPFPDAYNLAVHLSKKPNRNCIAIEDSSIGVQAARSANINCLLTLPPWQYNFDEIPKNANACVNSLGKENGQTKLFYGKPLNNKNVDYAYLSDIIN